jgi:septal ring factor EnvC (AmiA/AmiB activator)
LEIVKNKIKMAVRNAKTFFADKIKDGVEKQTAELSSQFGKVEARVVTLLDELVNVKAANDLLQKTNKQLNEELDAVKGELEETQKQYKVLVEVATETAKKQGKETQKTSKSAPKDKPKEE